MNLTEHQRPGSWEFPWYMGAVAATIALYIIALRTAGTPEGRRHLDGGIWLITVLLAILPLSYYGEYGPQSAPALPEPYDLLALLVLFLVGYRWSVRAGFRTEQLDRALAEDYPPDSREVRSG
ncbi:hypothetical protein [Streptomyces sp. KR55]|uniref:hypothetical protein n=1 Tax=Streptomyces sp. KR55 TaxID=3457425 RepID=UPI003FD58727